VTLELETYWYISHLDFKRESFLKKQVRDRRMVRCQLLDYPNEAWPDCISIAEMIVRGAYIVAKDLIDRLQRREKHGDQRLRYWPVVHPTPTMPS